MSETRPLFAICNETFQGWDWEKTCDIVAATGYDAVEIAPFTMAADVREVSAGERAKASAVAERAGLRVTGLHWLLVSPKGLSVTSPDDSVRQATSAYLEALVDFCADLGGSTMVFGSPAQRRIEAGDSREVALARYVDSLRPALARAEKAQIVICVEPLPAPEANFILNLEEAQEVVRALDSPAARVIFDVKSASAEGAPLPDLIRLHAGSIAHVHANDANRRGPGFGDTDFSPILRALRSIDYRGFVSVEVFDYTPDPVTIAKDSLAYLRGCLQGM